MAKLIPLDEAAAMLGVPPEKLAELRSRNEIFGYRDGSTWKFKESEIERVAGQLGVEVQDAGVSGVDLPGPAPGQAVGGDIDADLDELVDVMAPDRDEEEDTDGPDSVLVSEQELGGSDPSASSTIIGKNQLGGSDADLELNIPDDEESSEELVLDIDDDRSAADAVGGGHLEDDRESELPDGTDANSAEDASRLSLGQEAASDESPTAGNEVGRAADSSVQSVGGSELNLDFSSGSELDLSGESSELTLEPPSDILSSGGSRAASGQPSDLGGSEISLDGASDVNLAESDIELDLDGSGTGIELGGVDSDVTLHTGDSGINLNSPSESGISLEDTPPEIAAGSDIEALELGEADVIDLGDEAVDFDDATLQADDDFLLTPVEGGEAADESDSGSQVIALDTEEIEGDEATLLTEEVGERDEAAELATLAEGGVETVAPLGVGAEAAVEAAYSIWNVLGLGSCALILAIGGMMITDLVRNMWSWSGTYSLNSSLMDFVIGIFGG